MKNKCAINMVTLQISLNLLKNRVKSMQTEKLKFNRNKIKNQF